MITPSDTVWIPVGDGLEPEQDRLTLYRDLLIQTWLDGMITDEEEAMLMTLRRSIRVSKEDHLRIQDEVRRAVYLNALWTVWADKIITADEANYLKQLRYSMSITKEQHDELESIVRKEILLSLPRGAVMQQEDSNFTDILKRIEELSSTLGSSSGNSISLEKTFDQFLSITKSGLNNEWLNTSLAKELNESVGRLIASRLGVIFNGIQEATGPIAPQFVFTDLETGSTFMSLSIDQAQRKLALIRRSFSTAKEVHQNKQHTAQLLEKGIQFYKDGEFENAIASLNHVLKVDPKNGKAKFYLKKSEMRATTSSKAR